jgi:hypothetical protein
MTLENISQPEQYSNLCTQIVATPQYDAAYKPLSYAEATTNEPQLQPKDNLESSVERESKNRKIGLKGKLAIGVGSTLLGWGILSAITFPFLFSGALMSLGSNSQDKPAIVKVSEAVWKVNSAILKEKK